MLLRHVESFTLKSGALKFCFCVLYFASSFWDGLFPVVSQVSSIWAKSLLSFKEETEYSLCKSVNLARNNLSSTHRPPPFGSGHTALVWPRMTHKPSALDPAKKCQDLDRPVLLMF
jgi:hypothetical protein